MNVTTLKPVADFLQSLDRKEWSRAHRLIILLQEHGHELSMPVAKPIGRGLWELRSKNQPAIRILYGFCGGTAVLVHALKKQRPALLPREVELALARLTAYCG